MATVEDKIAYCPRCDDPFTGLTRVLAIRAMEEHMKVAHPAYYREMKDDES